MNSFPYAENQHKRYHSWNYALRQEFDKRRDDIECKRDIQLGMNICEPILVKKYLKYRSMLASTVPIEMVLLQKVVVPFAAYLVQAT